MSREDHWCFRFSLRLRRFPIFSSGIRIQSCCRSSRRSIEGLFIRQFDSQPLPLTTRKNWPHKISFFLKAHDIYNLITRSFPRFKKSSKKRNFSDTRSLSINLFLKWQTYDSVKSSSFPFPFFPIMWFSFIRFLNAFNHSTRVVLPAPFGPRSATNWPLGIERSIPFTAWTVWRISRHFLPQWHILLI